MAHELDEADRISRIFEETTTKYNGFENIPDTQKKELYGKWFKAIFAGSAAIQRAAINRRTDTKSIDDYVKKNFAHLP